MYCLFRRHIARIVSSAVASAALIAEAAGPTGLLNDTGQTLCYDGSAMVACTAANTGDGAPYPRQDGRFGRDRAGMAKIGGGAAGFDFTKICMNGDAEGTGSCPANPTANTGAGPAADEWACTRDNVTNLVWSLESINNISWTDATSTSGGSPITLTNTASRCGFNSGWRVPIRRELLSLVLNNSGTPAIDSSYFPSTWAASYWTNDEYVSNAIYAWYVAFGFGGSYAHLKSSPHLVRLVRSGL